MGEEFSLDNAAKGRSIDPPASTKGPSFGLVPTSRMTVSGPENLKQVEYAKDVAADPDIANTSLFKAYYIGERAVIQVLEDGYYRADFFTQFRCSDKIMPAATDTRRVTTVMRLGSSRSIGLTSDCFNYADTIEMSHNFSRITQIKKDEFISIVMLVHQNGGDTELWTGSSDPLLSKIFSGLYLTKLN